MSVQPVGEKVTNPLTKLYETGAVYTTTPVNAAAQPLDYKPGGGDVGVDLQAVEIERRLGPGAQDSHRSHR